MKSTFLWTACVTPFNCNGDSIDYQSLQCLLTIQAEARNGIILLGSTGESLSLTDYEKRTLVKFVCKLKLNTKVIIGVPGVNLYQTLEWLDFCKDMPIYGYLMTTPIYTKPGIMGQTLWFEKLLEKAHVPAMLYNIPSRAGINLHPETAHNLSDHKKFWAIKDSSGTVDTLTQYKKVAPNIEVFCGDDNMISDMAAEGASGLVSVVANVWPSVVHKYVKQCMSGKNPQADSWQQACKALFTASNPIPTKALLYDTGLIKHKTVRLPLSTEDFPSVEKLRQVNKMILGWKKLTN
ncbi:MULTISPECIES: 4-hydroxy-tetrahydrodipicolinate synthase [Wolbachia]|uniref:4-hydroxy-tetrahydrodipicolinate synthase n=1 Tax=Wolbachia TaxID=953 RepID=UPI0002403F6C|nr:MULTISPECIES: 4-hydroxy-tetrahydrodipicolinate synthase [Wolbachia]UYC24317.1 4-hydroxy-tetrahydrodipicolinate synthase [Wolbachia endosymbiont of Aedes aegypti]QBB83324.1 4-hydroxy-tetrahydrodipicolinate synthase [Wolbachia pipientis wAlbB]QDW08130.1 4-hydroxy-tetrahydrodipicolinate synthase [Wolbachia pipientis]QDW09320.1 4-hydroxy-tetrahydrodipicolinate synthase [Wolbachia pipientis]QZA83527.1 4-hydroxy-tetrahydrodipicolinate synthase [Wolbachia pipientis]